MTRVFVGTAGWSIPRASAAAFDEEGTHLQRYARVLAGAEINSSFYRPHASATYERWALSTPPGFRFAVKVPRLITHDQKLRRARLPLTQFLEQSGGLAERRGPLLVQLPPSLAFEARAASRFFDVLRQLYDGFTVCEPRHATWFAAEADALLVRYRIGRVAADPPRCAGAERPGGWDGIAYFRLHGSPRTYWSSYGDAYLATLAVTLRALPPAVERWCIFDNTASGAALANALALHERT